jgi:integrase
MASRTAFDDESLRKILMVLPQFSLRDQALVQCGLHTGFRATELGALTVGAVWTGGAVRPTVTLERRSLKGGRGCRRRSVRSRTLPITATLGEAIARYLSSRFADREPVAAEPLFLSRQQRGGLSRWQINHVLANIVAAAGCARDGRWGAHSLRKTFAQRIYRNSRFDINLTRVVMGHSDVGTTMKYLACSDEAAAAAVLALDERHVA